MLAIDRSEQYINHIGSGAGKAASGGKGLEQNHHFRGAWRCYPARRFQEARPNGDEAGRVWIFGEPAAEKIGVGLERPAYCITIHPALNGMIFDYRQGMDFETGADVMSCHFGTHAYVRSAQYLPDRRVLYIQLKAEGEVRLIPSAPPKRRYEDGFCFELEEVTGVLRCLTPAHWVDEALCAQGQAVLALALGEDACHRTLEPFCPPAPSCPGTLRLGEKADDFSASNERMSLDAAQNRSLDALLCRFFGYHSRQANPPHRGDPSSECDKLTAWALQLVQNGQGDAAYSVLIQLCRTHLNDGLYLESGDVRGLSGSMDAQASRQLPGATLVMAYAIQRMLICPTETGLSLLPALPKAWPSGRLSNLTLGPLELEYLEWNLPGRWVDVKIRALEPAALCLRFPASVPGECGAASGGKEMELRLSRDERTRRFVRLSDWGG